MITLADYPPNNGTNSNNSNQVQNNGTIIEIKNVTLKGPTAVFLDDVLYVVITKDQATADNLREAYLGNVSSNNESFYTPFTQMGHPGVYKVYGYSPTLSVLFLQDSLKYTFVTVFCCHNPIHIPSKGSSLI